MPFHEVSDCGSDAVGIENKLAILANIDFMDRAINRGAGLGKSEREKGEGEGES